MLEVFNTAPVQELLDRLSGLPDPGGDPRLKAIVRRIVGDLFATIDAFDVNEDEFWTALNFLAAGAPELGLWAAGLGFERYLDIRMDVADAASGITGGTPRTIEGPLYVAGAPVEQGFGRLDDGTDKGDVLVMHGHVRDVDGKPLEGALVEVWHANTLGNYSYFDKSQSAFNLRRAIKTGRHGDYSFRSIVPSGYGCPPGGSTERLLHAIGRHGQRPAHIHFFISAPRHRHLTTQINIEGDPYLHDDFAYATRDGLIPTIKHHKDGETGKRYRVEGPFAEIEFDFVLHPALSPEELVASSRSRALAT
jgi:catechol 1,2-dioxygenase